MLSDTVTISDVMLDDAVEKLKFDSNKQDDKQAAKKPLTLYQKQRIDIVINLTNLFYPSIWSEILCYAPLMNCDNCACISFMYAHLFCGSNEDIGQHVGCTCCLPFICISCSATICFPHKENCLTCGMVVCMQCASFCQGVTCDAVFCTNCKTTCQNCDDIYCSGCLRICESCNNTVCRDGMEQCLLCKMMVCACDGTFRECMQHCSKCKKPICETCLSRCRSCGTCQIAICTDCINVCELCGLKSQCETNNLCNMGCLKKICCGCTRQCERCERFGCLDCYSKQQCVGCLQSLCRNCMLRCDKCGQDVCYDCKKKCERCDYDLFCSTTCAKQCCV